MYVPLDPQNVTLLLRMWPKDLWRCYSKDLEKRFVLDKADGKGPYKRHRRDTEREGGDVKTWVE